MTKAILMAAGVGSRISRRIGGKPKCLLEINGEKLISRTCRLLNKKGITDITVVVGYKSDEVIPHLEKNVDVFFSPFFRVSNSIASLWFAKEKLEEEETIILNADLYFEEKVLDVILSEEIDGEKVIIAADSARIEDSDYRLNFQGERLFDHGKDLELENTTGEYVGIAYLSKEYVKDFKSRLEDLVEKKEQLNLWWENIIWESVPNHDLIKILDVKPLFWAEMDYIEDFERTKKHVEEE